MRVHFVNQACVVALLALVLGLNLVAVFGGKCECNGRVCQERVSVSFDYTIEKHYLTISFVAQVSAIFYSKLNLFINIYDIRIDSLFCEYNFDPFIDSEPVMATLRPIHVCRLLHS